MSKPITQFTDVELIDLLRKNDQASLVEIYNRYWKKLFVVAANMTANTHDAEECVQNVFLSLWNRREKIHLTHTLQTYLSVSVKYQSLTILAKRKDAHHLEYSKIPHLSTDHANPEVLYVSKELTERIESSINNLPEKCRIIYRMKSEEGKSVKSIAQELNISVNTVKMQLKIANRRLKDDILIIIPFLIFFS